MPTLEELRLRTGQLVTEDWYDSLVDYLEQLGYGGVISLYGYVVKDLVPIVDLLLNLGIPLRRWLEVHVGYGYFAYNAWIQGKQVLKDGDPITVEDLGTSAQTKITSAIDGSQVAKAYQLKPVQLGYAISYSAPDMGDCFASDLIALYDGRFRFKFEAQNNIYAYLKFTHVGQASAIIAALNAGSPIPLTAWHEFDFTSLVGDKVNFRITPNATLTVIVYNIPNA